MKAIIQTVKDASCSVGERLISEMKEGLLVYFGVEKGDKIEDLEAFLLKILRLRIFVVRKIGKQTTQLWTVLLQLC